MRANFDEDSNPNSISKKFWAFVKSSSNTSRIPDTISCNGSFRNTPVDKTNMFNDFFHRQFSDKSYYNVDCYFANDRFRNFKINHKDVRNLLRAINPNKSCGPDGITGKDLKNCSLYLAYPLTLIFNLCFSCGQLPAEWKIANIVPIHKKGDKSHVQNYKQISLTSIASKVFEKCIRNELLKMCEPLIHPSQHGFLPGKSCTTQLIPFIDNLSFNLNCRLTTDIVYFDFSKAFDTVNHDLILHKLKYKFGVDGLMLKLLTNYLFKR